jgi:hypothetical protein
MLSALANGYGLTRKLARGGCAPLVILSAVIPLLSGCPGVQVTGDSTTGNASLSWTAPTTDTDGVPVTGLSGYRIYVGRDTTNMELRGGTSGADSTTFLVSGLGKGTYYFAVTAYNYDGAESAKSNIGSKSF